MDWRTQREQEMHVPTCPPEQLRTLISCPSSALTQKMQYQLIIMSLWYILCLSTADQEQKCRSLDAGFVCEV